MALPLTTIPVSFTIGNTLDVVLSFGDFPAPTYNAVLYLTSHGKTTITVNAIDYSSEHRFLLSGGSTQSWVAGTYDWMVRVDGLGVLVTAASGKITLLPDPAQLNANSDARSHARKTLDLLQAAIEGRLPNALDSYSVDGRTLNKVKFTELVQMRDRYQGIVNAEEAKAAGQSTLRTHKFAFRRS